MKFGLFTSLGGMTWSALQSLWHHLEATGWDAACVADHFMPNAPDPCPGDAGVLDGAGRAAGGRAAHRQC